MCKEYCGFDIDDIKNGHPGWDIGKKLNKEYIDLSDSKSKTSITEEQLREALDWIENHKQKSIKHDQLLKTLVWASGIMIFPTTFFTIFVIALGYGIKMVTLFNFIPVIVAGLYIYTMLEKVKEASKE